MKRDATSPRTREQWIDYFIETCASPAFSRDEVRMEAQHIIAGDGIYARSEIVMPEGWRAVPIKPTLQMREAAVRLLGIGDDVVWPGIAEAATRYYTAMVGAAPEAPRSATAAHPDDRSGHLPSNAAPQPVSSPDVTSREPSGPAVAAPVPGGDKSLRLLDDAMRGCRIVRDTLMEDDSHAHGFRDGAQACMNVLGDMLAKVASAPSSVATNDAPKCDDCGFTLTRGILDRSGQEWSCAVCSKAGIRLSENKRLREELAKAEARLSARRENVLEEAAKVCEAEKESLGTSHELSSERGLCLMLAIKIRALKQSSYVPGGS